MTVDMGAYYVSFTRDGAGESYCTIVVPSDTVEVRFPLPDLERIGSALAPEVLEVARRAAPALPEGNRVGIMAKVTGVPERVIASEEGDLVAGEWDTDKGRFFEETAISFDDLMLCVERHEHEWRYHSFAGQDRCTRCQVLKDGSYIL